MAVTISTVYEGVDFKEYEVIADADADVAATIDHGLESIPSVWITPILAEAALSLWRVVGITATQIILEANNTVGSGAAGEQLRVSVFNRGAPRLG